MREAESGHAAWLAKACNDLLNITNNLAAEEVPWDTVCFHAQQAAEKLLKAVLTYHEIPPGRTHDLVVLLTECLEVEPSMTDLEEDCRRLTSYAVSSRYPDVVYEPTEQDARAMFAAALRVRDAVLRHLP